MLCYVANLARYNWT